MKDKQIPFFPYYLIKDLVYFFFFIILFFLFIFYFPTTLGHVDNYIEANSFITPSHITPETYLLPYYAILRSIPDKTYGILIMIFSLLILCLLPFIQPSLFINKSFRFSYHLSISFFFLNFFFLGFLATQLVIYPYIILSILITFNYFFFFFLFFLFSFFEFFFFFL